MVKKIKMIQMLIFGLITLVLVNSVTALVNDSVVYYSFDNVNLNGNDIGDLSGYGSNATNVGAETGRPGILGESFKFISANSDFVYTPINYVNDQGGISFWTKWNETTNTFFMGFDEEESNYDALLLSGYFNSINDRYGFQIFSDYGGTGGRAQQAFENSLGQDNAWHHIVWSWDLTPVTPTVVMWVDGTSEVSVGSTLDDIDGWQDLIYDLTIGARNNKGLKQGYFNGSIDEVAFYNRTLSQANVNELYNSGVGFNPYWEAPILVNVTSILPLNNSYNDTASPAITIFQCNASGDETVTNVSLYITDSSNTNFAYVDSVNPQVTEYLANFTKGLENGNYTWGCYAEINETIFDWSTNRSYEVNYTAVTGFGASLTIEALTCGMSLNQSSISFGNVATEQQSNEIGILINNTGTAITDIKINGSSWNSSLYSMEVNVTKFSNASLSYASKDYLQSTENYLYYNLGSYTTFVGYFQLQPPSAQTADLYSQTMTLSTTC